MTSVMRSFLVFSCGDFGAAACFEFLCTRLIDLDVLERTELVTVYGSLDTVAAHARKLKSKHSFHAQIGDVDVGFNELPRFGITQVILKYPTDRVPIDSIIKALPRTDAFVMGWVVDAEFDFWQNAQDPKEYVQAGRSTEGLPFVSNGLRPPNQQMIIDTRQNPGRRCLRQRYVEAVGATMWIGPRFAQQLGARPNLDAAKDWLRIDSLPQGITRLEAATAPFTAAEGRERELQDKLRTLLFPSQDRSG